MARPTVNPEFFSCWSPAMAYVLGFIASDGCLIEYPNGYNGIDITNKDRKLLSQIRKEMKSGHKVSKKTRGYRLQIRNITIYNDLLKLGLTPRKSKTLEMPYVPIQYLRHFARGFFDGDGGVTVWREPRWRNTWQIRTTFTSGSRSFLEKLQIQLSRIGNLRKGKIWKGKRSPAYELHYGIDDSIRLYEFMYKNNPSLYLKRKKDKFKLFQGLRGQV